jgi:hypothetical protein
LPGGAVPDGVDPAPDSLSMFALNAEARRYFLSPARPPVHPGGGSPGGFVHGRAGKAAEGTLVAFEFKIADGIVKSARFTAFGCPHTLAVVQWLCEVLEGAPVGSGQPGTPAEWAARFDVPPEKLGRLLIVEDALHAALR